MPKSSAKKIGILGGGLSGLTLASLLKPKKVPFEVLEKETVFGGLMRSHQAEGFTFDCYGSHILFSKNPSALGFLVNLLSKNKAQRKRNTRVLYGGRYVKYPFENGLSDLSKKDNFECLNGFIEARLNGGCSKPKNLREWCYDTFGRGIAEKYLIPYNEKIWKYPSDKLGVSWVERIPNPPMEDIVKSSVGLKTEGYTHQLYFYYPKIGGIQAVTDALLAVVSDDVTSGFEVKKISKQGNSYVVSNGKREKLFDKLVSTIPLHELIKTLDVPSEIQVAVESLEYNSIACVMLGLKKPKMNRLSWLYIPEKKVLSHRISFPSNYGPCTSPKDKSSVLAEVTYRDGDDISKMSNPEICKRVVSDLESLKILDSRDVCYNHVERAKYAYVINDFHYTRNLKIATDYFEEQGISLLGRFAEFQYLNMDACVERAQNLSRTILPS